jgi:hypothetical protein
MRILKHRKLTQGHPVLVVYSISQTCRVLISFLVFNTIETCPNSRGLVAQRLSQEDQSSRPARATQQDPASKQNKNPVEPVGVTQQQYLGKVEG